MKYPTYPKLKPSGIPWLGDVPAHWQVKRSDSCISSNRSQIEPDQFKGMKVFHYSIPTVQELGTGKLEDGTEIASAKQVITSKVVLVSKLNPRKATICTAEQQGMLTLCSPEFVSLEPRGCSLEFLTYFTRSEGFRQLLDSRVQSVTNSHQRVNPRDIYRFWNAWPPLSEQVAIAAFLDRETAKIDALVAKVEAAIEELQQYRTALISSAVTGKIDVRSAA